MKCGNCGHKVKRYHGKWYHSHGYLVRNLTLKCSNCDCRTPYIPAEHIAIKPSMDWFIFNFLNKIKYKLNKKPYYNHFNSNKFFNNLVWMIILSLTFAVLFYNINNINLHLKGFPLGNILLLINGIFWIKYSYQMLKGVVYWYGDQRNWTKCLVVLIFLSFAWQSYQQKETILSPLIDLANQNPIDTGLKQSGLYANSNSQNTYPSNFNNKKDGYYPSINGASGKEREYIINILNNTKPEIVSKINSINIISSDAELATDCKDEKAGGCASTDGIIYIMSISFWNSPHLRKGENVDAGAGYMRCTTFAWTLNHEIGHIKGFSIGDSSEEYAENYAYDHTTVNTVYEHEKRC